MNENQIIKVFKDNPKFFLEFKFYENDLNYKTALVWLNGKYPILEKETDPEAIWEISKLTKKYLKCKKLKKFLKIFKCKDYKNYQNAKKFIKENIKNENI